MGFDSAREIEKKYFSAAELLNADGTYRTMLVTPIDARTGRYQNGDKSLEILFKEHHKWFGLNATNRKFLESVGGSTNSDSYMGKTVEAYVQTGIQTMNGGTTVGIRLRHPGSGSSAPARTPATATSKALLIRAFSAWANIDSKDPNFVASLTKYAASEGASLSTLLEDEATKLVASINRIAEQGMSFEDHMKLLADLPPF